MNKHISHLLLLSCAIVLMSGCTLEPHMYHGEDILDDTPTAPVPHQTFIDEYEGKTDSQKPVVKEEAKPKTVAVVKETVKTPEKVTEKVSEKPAVTPSPVKEEVKEVPVKATVKEEPKQVSKPVVKTETTAKPCAGGDVAPPAAPSAGGLQKQLLQHGSFRPGDRLKVTVYREKDLSGTYEVNDKGTINFPLLGQVKAIGLTSAELEENLTKSLSAGYLVKPEVSVEYLPDCIVK